MKKAQEEILGIVFIIIIISALFMFFLVSGNYRQGTTIKQNYQQNQLAFNTLYTLMKTTVKSSNAMMSDLVKKCIKSGNCDDVKVKITEYLDFTFADKGFNYKFSAEYDRTEYIKVQHGNCNERRTGFLFMPLDNKDIELRLEVC